MKRVYLIHGWDGRPDSSWRPWLKMELEKRGYEVQALSMPHPEAPDMKTWIPFLQTSIALPDENTILVGHSMGGNAALRYAETLPEGVVLGAIICVAPVVDFIKNQEGEDAEIAKPWLETPLDGEKIRKSARRIVGFFSDNDEWIPLESAKVFEQLCGATIHIEHEKGHYGDLQSVKEVPSVLEEILR